MVAAVTTNKWPQDWKPCQKHRKATVKTWNSGQAKQWSKSPGAAQYNPLEFGEWGHHAIVEWAEKRCIEKGTLISSTDVKRTYWYDLAMDEDRKIAVAGVCSGEETSLIYVEWHSAGHIHGRPISRGALDKFLSRARKASQ